MLGTDASSQGAVGAAKSPGRSLGWDVGWDGRWQSFSFWRLWRCCGWSFGKSVVGFLESLPVHKLFDCSGNLMLLTYMASALAQLSGGAERLLQGV